MSQDICESEHLLGRRIVNYLRNEATVGRINNKKLKVEVLISLSKEPGKTPPVLHYKQYSQKQKRL